MDRPVLLRPDCVAMGGDVVVGVLLSQIVYWYALSKGKSKLRVKRGGVYWIAKTREDWMNETGLTQNQYRRAISVLRQKKIIEVRMMRFDGIKMSHIRLISVWNHSPGEEESTNSVKGKPPTGSQLKTTHPVELKPLTEDLHRLHTEITTETTDRSGGEDTALTGEDLDRRIGRKRGEEEEDQDQDPDPEKDPPLDLSRGDAMKAADVLKAHKAAAMGNLGAYWQSRIQLSSDYKKYQVPLTKKQRGQLAMLRKRVGDDWVRPVIAYAVEHWWAFATTAGSAAGTDWPTHEDIGFLLKHCELAMNLLVKRAARDQQEAQRVLAMADEPPPTKPTVEPEPVHVATPQEVADLLDYFETPKE